jgi:hypothetical protein
LKKPKTFLYLCRGSNAGVQLSQRSKTGNKLIFVPSFFAYCFLKAIEKIDWFNKIRGAIFAQIKTPKK